MRGGIVARSSAMQAFLRTLDRLRESELPDREQRMRSDKTRKQRSAALRALEQIGKEAARSGRDGPSMKEIEAEIRAARKARRR